MYMRLQAKQNGHGTRGATVSANLCSRYHRRGDAPNTARGPQLRPISQGGRGRVQTFAAGTINEEKPKYRQGVAAPANEHSNDSVYSQTVYMQRGYERTRTGN